MCVCMCVCSVAQPCLTLCHPMDCSPPGSSCMGFPRHEYWGGLPFPPPGCLPGPGMEPGWASGIGSSASSASWEAHYPVYLINYIKLTTYTLQVTSVCLHVRDGLIQTLIFLSLRIRGEFYQYILERKSLPHETFSPCISF